MGDASNLVLCRRGCGIIRYTWAASLLRWLMVRFLKLSNATALTVSAIIYLLLVVFSYYDQLYRTGILPILIYGSAIAIALPVLMLSDKFTITNWILIALVVLFLILIVIFYVATILKFGPALL
jgi:hypothetical protein